MSATHLNVRILRAFAKHISASADEIRVHLRTVHTMPFHGGTIYSATNGHLLARAYDAEPGGPSEPMLFDATALRQQQTPSDESEIRKPIEALSDSRWLIGDIATYSYPATMFPNLTRVFHPIARGEPCVVQPRYITAVHAAYWEAFGIDKKFQSPMTPEYIPTGIDRETGEVIDSQYMLRSRTQDYIAVVMPLRADPPELAAYLPWHTEFHHDLDVN